MNETLFTPMEVQYLTQIYTAEAILEDLPPGKPGYSGQVFLLLACNKRNPTMRGLETDYYVAKSALNDLLPRSGSGTSNDQSSEEIFPRDVP